MMLRRQAMGGALAAAAVPVGAREGRAAEGRPLSVMTWGGAWGESQAVGVDAAFTRQTGVAVAQDRTVSPGDRITKAKVNLRRQIYDVIWLNDALAVTARKQGVLAPLDPASPRLPNLRDVRPRFLSRDFVAVVFSAAGVAYNPKFVKEPFASWADLWRPELRGRVVVQSFGHSFGPAVIPVGALAAGKTVRDEEAGFEMLGKLAALDPIWVPDTDSLLNAYRSEEAVAGILYKSQAYTVQGAGTPVRWVYPKEGALSIYWGLGVVQGTGSPELAEQYVNAACDPSAQVQFTRTHNYPGSNRRMAAMLPPELRDRGEWSEAELGGLIDLDYEWIAERRAAWSERWNRVVAK